jgi:cytochrome c-type biogenesis protein CcmH/NrfF
MRRVRDGYLPTHYGQLGVEFQPHVKNETLLLVFLSVFVLLVACACLLATSYSSLLLFCCIVLR